MAYENTNPRGPIQGMYHAPGRHGYELPDMARERPDDPRSVHYRHPSYSFGARTGHGKYSDEAGPGPAYYPQTKIYRNGRDGTPHYSLYDGPREQTRYKTPGPGWYAQERSGQPMFSMAPAWQLTDDPRSVQEALRRTDTTSGPNAYNSDPRLGHTIRSSEKPAPLYSMNERRNVGSAVYQALMAKTPGPGAYGTITPEVYKQKPPAYSMTGRNAMPGDSTRIPGPGAHSPEQVYGTEGVVSAFSFGILHSQY